MGSADLDIDSADLDIDSAGVAIGPAGLTMRSPPMYLHPLNTVQVIKIEER